MQYMCSIVQVYRMSNERPRSLKRYMILISVCLALITPTRQNNHHRGSTVDGMLARYLKHEADRGVSIENCDSVGGCEGMSNATSEGSNSVDDELCWGYEKKCNKRNRLFVPQCDGPAKPW